MVLEKDVSLLKQIHSQTEETQRLQVKLLECQNRLLEYQHENQRLIKDLGNANQKVQRLSTVVAKLTNTATKESRRNETLNKKVDNLKKEIENKDIKES